MSAIVNPDSRSRAIEFLFSSRKNHRVWKKDKPVSGSLRNPVACGQWISIALAIRA